MLNTNDNGPIFRFDGIDAPNTTPMPDVYFDLVIPELTAAEIRILLYIVRRTFGFKKDTDPISFNQFLKGITTKDGRTLDKGCGLKSRSHLSKALKSLEAKGVIVSGKSLDEKGENQTTIYGLRFKDPRVVPFGHYPGARKALPVVPEAHPQQTVLQETVKQESDDDIAAILEKFGVSKLQAQRISANYAPELIMEKLDLVQYLESVKSSLVARNPQGFLVRAIDENYLPAKIRGYRSKAQREQEEQERKQEEGEIERAQQTRQKAITSFIRNRAEKQITGTNLTTKTAWVQALDYLQKDISSANFNMWLLNTLMVDYEKDRALIGAPSSYVAEWLQGRMRSRVANALSNVIGRRVEVEFEAVPEMTRGDADERGKE